MRKSLVYIAILFFLISCEKEEEYSYIPSITFKDFNFDIEDKGGFFNQVGYLRFDFVDGNGDIGFPENLDTLASTEEIPDIFLYEHTKINGNFVPTDTIKYLLLEYFPEQVYNHLKGEIAVKIYFINRENDTVKYDFQIMDRDYHLSNLESTPELIVPVWN